MSTDLDTLVSQAQVAFAAAATPADLENAKALFLGKTGAVTELLKGLAKLDVDAKKAQGAAINVAKTAIETALTAAREVLEETGLDANQYDLQDWQASNTYQIYPHWRHRYAPGVVENVEHLFGLELPQVLPITLAPDEHTRYEWVDWREAANRVFSWTNIDALKRLGARHNLTL